MNNTKCGQTVPKDETTVWWTDVDCADCNPYTWMPTEIGLKMVRRDEVETPPKRVVRRRKSQPSTAPAVKVVRRRSS